MTTQDALWATAIFVLVLAMAAGVADWRRGRRRDLDDAGWVPWPAIQILALFGALLLAVFAMRA